MNSTKNDLILFIEKFEYIQLYFGKDFLEKAISHYFRRKKNTPYYHIANFMFWNQLNNKFFNELEELFIFFCSNTTLEGYLYTPRVRNKLKSMDEVEFHSIWSEIIFAFHLHKLGYKITKIGQVKGESTELADIVTDNGLYEVTTVISEKDRYETDEVFWGSNEISSISRKIINSKISKKRNQNKATHIVIDCTFMDDLTEKLITSSFLKIEPEFNVFKECHKDLTLFTRNNVTQQVGAKKTFKFHF